MKSNLEPTGHHVLIKPDDIETVTEGGIVLQAQFDRDLQSRERAATTTGTIIAIGKTAWLDFAGGEPWAEVGDRVYFTKHVAKELKDGENTFFLMSDENVVCVIRGK